MAISDDFEVDTTTKTISWVGSHGSPTYSGPELYNMMMVHCDAEEIKEALDKSSLENVIKRFKWDKIERAAAYDKELCERLAKPPQRPANSKTNGSNNTKMVKSNIRRNRQKSYGSPDYTCYGCWAGKR